MTPEQLSVVILGIVGVLLSLVFKYWAPAKSWFDAQPHQGLLMLAFCVIVGGVYFALSCTPFGALVGVSLECSAAGAFVLVKAIFIVATSNQIAFLTTPGGPKPSR